MRFRWSLDHVWRKTNLLSIFLALSSCIQLSRFMTIYLDFSVLKARFSRILYLHSSGSVRFLSKHFFPGRALLKLLLGFSPPLASIKTLSSPGKRMWHGIVIVYSLCASSFELSLVPADTSHLSYLYLWL